MNLSDLYFSINDFDGDMFVTIVPKTFWEANHHMSDTEDYDNLVEALPLGLYRSQECVYEIDNNMTLAALKAALEKAGLTFSQEFQDYNNRN